MAIEYGVDGNGSALVVSLAGKLGLPDVAPLHGRLLKALAEQPEILLIDLADLHVEEPLSLSVFTAITRQAARWPGTPVVLCGPPPATRELLTGPTYHRLPLYESLAAARADMSRQSHTLPTITEELLPVSGAARHARNVATDACLRWDLPDLIAPASHVASEMVANVVDHAHTMMTLRLSLRSRYLSVAVRDGNGDEPKAPESMPIGVGRGRGLLLIAAMSHAWGWMPTDDGKVVWAALRRPRP